VTLGLAAFVLVAFGRITFGKFTPVTFGWIACGQG